MSDAELIELALRRIVMREHKAMEEKGSSNLYKIEFFSDLADEIANIRASLEETTEAPNQMPTAGDFV